MSFGIFLQHFANFSFSASHSYFHSKLANLIKEPLYEIKGEKQNIFVTGKHFVFDKTNKKWIQVKNYNKAKIQPELIPEYFSCLITTNRHIEIDSELFWDWEDDELTNLSLNIN